AAQCFDQLSDDPSMNARRPWHHYDTTSSQLIAPLRCLHPSEEGGLIHAQVRLDIHDRLIASYYRASRGSNEEHKIPFDPPKAEGPGLRPGLRMYRDICRDRLQISNPFRPAALPARAPASSAFRPPSPRW